MLGRVGLLAFGLLTVVGSWFVTCQLWKYREIAAGVAWLETRSFDDITLITIGTGSAYENPRRMGPATAVALESTIVLVDAGRGVSEALRLAEIPVRQPEAVFLTSLLPENTVGLDDLLFAGWMSPRERPLRVIGPRGTAALCEALYAAHRHGREHLEGALELPAAGAEFAVTEINGSNFEESIGPLEIRAAAVGNDALPQYAYRFAAGRKSVVVSGGGPDLDALGQFAKGTWVLVAEGFLQEAVDAAIAAGTDDAERLRREAALHRDLGDVATTAREAGVLGLVLTRLRPPPLFDSQYETPAGEYFDGQIAVAEDGNEFRP